MSEQTLLAFNPDSTGDGSSHVGPAVGRHGADRVAALDELFIQVGQYRTSRSYAELLSFVAKFRSYSPFNAMLVHIQMPGAGFVASAGRWQGEYGRVVRANARPLVILQPRGPVMFVFDVSDTEPLEGAPALPPSVERPFEVRGAKLSGELDRVIENARRDGVDVLQQESGSQSAGAIQPAEPGRFLRVLAKQRPAPEYKVVKLRYELLLNSGHKREVQFATLVHELGHLYCGHLGTPDPAWWQDRRGLGTDVDEFEAESVSYLVCRRLGIETPSEEYLGSYYQKYQRIPPISVDTVLKAAGLIEQMTIGRMPPRKDSTPRAQA